MYSDVIPCLDPVFKSLPNFSVVDTHAMRKPLAPDFSIHCGQNGWLNLCVFLYLLTRYMRPEGPWQQRFSHPLSKTKSCPQPLWVILGNPCLLLPIIRRTKERISKRQRKETKEKYSLGRARPALLAFRHLPDTLSVVHSRPSHSRGPGPNRRVLQKFNHCLRRLLPPHPSRRRRPGMFPPAILPNPLPRRLDLRRPRSALCKEVVSRLPPPAAAPPALIRLQPLGARHAVMGEGANRSVAGRQLVVALCR